MDNSPASSFPLPHASAFRRRCAVQCALSYVRTSTIMPKHSSRIALVGQTACHKTLQQVNSVTSCIIIPPDSARSLTFSFPPAKIYGYRQLTSRMLHKFLLRLLDRQISARPRSLAFSFLLLVSHAHRISRFAFSAFVDYGVMAGDHACLPKNPAWPCTIVPQNETHNM